jgi:RNase H-like domain found in reverse transcriptase
MPLGIFKKATVVLCVSEVEYLGHLIRKDGFLPNEKKISNIRDTPIPKTTKDVKSFLGLASYYRKFIKDFATLASGLNVLLKKGIKFDFNERAKISFDMLKQKLISPPILSYPNFDNTFIISTDASDYGLGAVLSQLDDENLDHPISYASRSLNTSESRYSTFDRELLAIVWAVTKQFRSFVYGRKFIVFSDHLPLVSLLSSRLDNGTPRIVRWKLKLLEFDFKIIFRKGSNNIPADFLSRIKREDSKEFIATNDKSQVKTLQKRKTLTVTPAISTETIKIYAVTRSSSKIEEEEATMAYSSVH